MSEALYRKYRPQTFEDVVGQTHIERTLKNAIESDKVSHAYLFCGPRGTGKTTTARLLAKALLCDGGPTPSPDGTCEQCTAIAEGLHPDVSELDAASRTGVENVREEIIGRVQYAPTRGRYKIYIIDEVHMLSTAAFNALLKTLEEPPSHVVFVLCTTDPQRVPETIHSRCQRFDFHRLSNDEIVSRLGAVCVAEGVEFEGDALDLVAHRAQGGMRDALTALEQLIAFGGGKVTVEVAQSVLGSIDTDDMSTVVDAIAARDAAACFTWLSEYVETGADLARFARDLAGYVRDLYVLVLTDGALALDAPQAARPAMAKQAAAFGSDRLAYVLRVLGDLSAELRSSVNPRLSFEIALTRMVRPESDLTLDALAARVATLEAALASGAAAVAPASAAASAAVPASPRKDGEKAPAPVPAASPATIPVVASGYRFAAPAPAAAAASAQGFSAADKSAAFRAQMEQRRAAKASARVESAPPAAAPAESPAASSSTQRAAAGPLPDEVRAKIADPSALQRGWQAAVADLKQRRAAYGALMLSARVVAQDGGEGLFIEFARENTFAYSAAQKPDISAAIAAALEGAFGAPVPFSITQGEGSSSPARAAMARAAAMRAAAPAQQPAAAPAASIEAPAYEPDDVVPYDDGDAVPYSDADVESYAPWDDYAASPANDASGQPYAQGAGRQAGGKVQALARDASSAANVVSARAPQAAVDANGSATQVAESASATAASAPSVAPSPAAAPAAAATPAVAPAAPAPVSAAAPAPSQVAAAPAAGAAPSVASVPPAAPPFSLETADSDAEQEYDFSVEGPEPVDPYAIGKKIGFDSMPAPKKRNKNMIVPVGWPGVDVGKKPAAKKASKPKRTVAEPEPVPVAPAPNAEGMPGSPEQRQQPSASMSAAAIDRDFTPVSSDASQVGEPQPAVPARPNPFASRPMPAGIGGNARPAPEPEPQAASAADAMDVADIFGSFGVSFEDVKEER